jgi:SAM-dependent methyltransferase
MNQIANSDMSEFWNTSGGRMWVDNQAIISSSMTPIGQVAMNALNLTEGDRVLDIGCGFGDTSFEISQRVGVNGRVLGVDISRIIIASANKNMLSKKHKNVSFECIDAQTHKFPKHNFDVVYSRLGVMFFEDSEAAFSNIRQSLTPGGRMAFVCWQPVEAIEWISLPLEIVASYVSLPPPSPSGSSGPFSFGNPDKVKQVLNSAGFVDIKIEPSISKISIGVNTDEALKFLTHIGPAGKILDDPEIDIAIQARFDAELRSVLSSRLTNQGVELGAATWIVSARNS